jgi:hypothetical protein
MTFVKLTYINVDNVWGLEVSLLVTRKYIIHIYEMPNEEYLPCDSVAMFERR